MSTVVDNSISTEVKSKIFLVPCNYRFGTVTVIALAEDGDLLGVEVGGVFGNGFCTGAIPLREDKEYLDKYNAKYGENGYDLIYVDNGTTYEGLEEAISKCDKLESK